jgi:ABC-type sugar transport system substrate-binding protein
MDFPDTPEVSLDDTPESAWDSSYTRREVIKKTGAAAALMAGGISLIRVASAGAGVEASPKVNLLDGEVVFSDFVTLNREYYLQWHQGAKRAVDALGGTYRYAVDDQNAQVQVQHFEQQVKQGYNIFFNAAPDPSTLAPIAKLARDNQAYFTHFFEIPPWGSPFDPRLNPSPYFVTFFIPNFRAQGDAEATHLARTMGGKGNIVWITGYPGSTPDLQLSAGVKQALKRFPGIKIIGSQPGNWLQADSREAMAGFIRRFGNDINGVIGQNDDCGIGAADALQEAGTKGIPIVSNNGTIRATQYVLAGKYGGGATYAIFPAWNAGLAAVRAIDASQGWKPTVPERMMWTKGAVITRKNATGYLKYINGPDRFNWPLMSRIAHPKDWDPQGPLEPLDYDLMWEGVDKPSGFTYPAEIAQAKKSGEYARVLKLYRAHYKRKIYGD